MLLLSKTIHPFASTICVGTCIETIITSLLVTERNEVHRDRRQGAKGIASRARERLRHCGCYFHFADNRKPANVHVIFLCVGVQRFVSKSVIRKHIFPTLCRQTPDKTIAVLHSNGTGQRCGVRNPGDLCNRLRLSVL